MITCKPTGQAPHAMCSCITHLFARPEYLPPSGSTNSTHHRRPPSNENPCVRYARCTESSYGVSRRDFRLWVLFASAFMLASKVICDDTYSRQAVVNEREICQYLEWESNVDSGTLHTSSRR
ncbi:hypothetical protein BDN67DRAFT_640480 [Paxillus ammoniavirescens]|nr:hypothetical protein BDN67DRAFT_640480 [Paxillus ammoniavirescens]